MKWITIALFFGNILCAQAQADLMDSYVGSNALGSTDFWCKVQIEKKSSFLGQQIRFEITEYWGQTTQQPLDTSKGGRSDFSNWVSKNAVLYAMKSGKFYQQNKSRNNNDELTIVDQSTQAQGIWRISVNFNHCGPFGGFCSFGWRQCRIRIFL